MTYRDIGQSLQLRLPPGTHRFEGTFSGPAASMTLAIASREGSVTVGSMRVLSGPGNATPCGATFVNNSLSTAPVSFALQFQVQQGTSGSCVVN